MLGLSTKKYASLALSSRVHKLLNSPLCHPDSSLSRYCELLPLQNNPFPVPFKNSLSVPCANLVELWNAYFVSCYTFSRVYEVIKVHLMRRFRVRNPDLLDVGIAGDEQVVDDLGAAVLARPEEGRAAVGSLSDDVFSIGSTDAFDLSTQFVRKSRSRTSHLQQKIMY